MIFGIYAMYLYYSVSFFEPFSIHIRATGRQSVCGYSAPAGQVVTYGYLLEGCFPRP